MKQIAIIILTTLTLLSCKDEKKKPVALNGESVIIGIAKIDGQKQVRNLLRVIRDEVKYDSVKGEKIIATDTVYGYLKTMPVIDTVTKLPYKAKDGKDSVLSGWIAIHKDSVNTEISNIPLDRLLKN